MNKQNYINHIVFVLDASMSMYYRANDLVKVADKQIRYLAKRSKELDQETRVTVYSFNNRYNTKCLVYDKDVLRMPSISGLYKPDGNTALIDATITALDDLAETPEKYGEHAFLIYVLTDGEENDSLWGPDKLNQKIMRLPDNWTIGAFVPDQPSVFWAKSFGFPKENIAVWDTTTDGINEAGEKIRQTTDTFMQNRALGIKGTKNLFSLKTPSLSTVSTNLDSLHAGQYRLLEVDYEDRIANFVEETLGRSYVRGEAYYQLMKPETIQPQKKIALYAKHKIYVGDKARDLLGLPDYSVRVKPADYPEYEIFVQSTSVNRKLIEGTKLLVLS